MNTSSASEGIVWITPGRGQDDRPEPRPPRRDDAQRDRDDDRRRQRDRHQHQVLARAGAAAAPTNVLGDDRRPRPRTSPPGTRPRPRSSGTRSSFARAFIAAISAARDPALQPRERRDRRGRPDGRSAR